MNLKIYTSTVPAITSMGRIEKCLVQAEPSENDYWERIAADDDQWPDDEDGGM